MRVRWECGSGEHLDVPSVSTGGCCISRSASGSGGFLSRTSCTRSSRSCRCQASASVYGTTWSQRLWRMTRRLGVRGGSGSYAIADAGSSASGSICRERWARWRMDSGPSTKHSISHRPVCPPQRQTAGDDSSVMRLAARLALLLLATPCAPWSRGLHSLRQQPRRVSAPVRAQESSSAGPSPESSVTAVSEGGPVAASRHLGGRSAGVKRVRQHVNPLRSSHQQPLELPERWPETFFKDASLRPPVLTRRAIDGEP